MAQSDRYTDNEYFDKNPTWDLEDSPWKAELVAKLLEETGLRPATLCEIGCGAGGVLSSLRDKLPNTELSGFDIAPAAARFWEMLDGREIDFNVGDFFQISDKEYDVILLLDVLEHVNDPFSFLERLHGRSDYYVFHIPLDLSALSVLRESPLLHVRNKVGHIHYFTKNLALSLLRESGYEIVSWRYTGAAFSSPKRTWKTRLGALPRKIAYLVNRDLGVRILGGETLLVLAR